MKKPNRNERRKEKNISEDFRLTVCTCLPAGRPACRQAGKYREMILGLLRKLNNE